MNYLGHYVFNHLLCAIEPEPYFVLGVALPDLWARFSRKRRIRWKRVREARPGDAVGRALRNGLLNHVAADNRFHHSRVFLDWHRSLRSGIERFAAPTVVSDFVSHVAIELVLDHRLIRESPEIGGEFYDHIARCDTEAVESRISEIGHVDASGLGREIQGFVARRFLPAFARAEALAGVMEYILGLTSIREAPPDGLIAAALEGAASLVDPRVLWAQMRQVGRDAPIAAFTAG